MIIIAFFYIIVIVQIFRITDMTFMFIILRIISIKYINSANKFN